MQVIKLARGSGHRNMLNRIYYTYCLNTRKHVQNLDLEKLMLRLLLPNVDFNQIYDFSINHKS